MPKKTVKKAAKRLYLSVKDKMVCGVCGGVAEYFDIDPTMVRLAWVLLTFASGVVPGVFGYLVAAVIIPARPGKR